MKGTVGPALDAISSGMTLRSRVWLLVLAVTCLAFAASCTASASEGEYRGYFNVSRGFGDVKLRLAVESRSAASIDEFHYLSTGIGAEYGVGAHLVLGACYSRVDTESGDKWDLEQRPYADVTLRTKWAGADLSDRNRLEVRIRDGESTLRYRNRARLSVGLGASPLRATADGELFYDMEADEVNSTRLTAGLDMKIASSLRVGASYIYESKLKKDDWSGVHGVGLALSVDL
ncbi:MAG: DUF2490 domain-containing protein [Candidatus Eisenbacteria bacterium]|nr:DUF2490 domain-containing protein [Candidatus Eisenbacteria bacterium]